MMTLQKNLPLLKEFRLCLLAGNEVWLISRSPRLRVKAVRKTLKGINVQVVDGSWIALLSGERLRTSVTYGREWVV